MDTLTDEAIARGEPNLLVEQDDYYRKGFPLLNAVCIWQRLDLAEMLFDAGAVMTAGSTASIISWGADAATVKFLLARGAPVDAACLREPVRGGKWQTVVLLLDAGVEVQTPIYAGHSSVTGQANVTTLLHIAAWQGEGWLVRELLERGADKESRDGDEMTPLMKACDLRNPDIAGVCDALYWLLKHGADVNAVTQEGETALLLCTGNATKWRNRTHVAQMLLRRGANPNVAAPNGGTPLMFAARDNDEFLARALLRAGARTDARNEKGEAARDVARRWKSDQVLELL